MSTSSMQSVLVLVQLFQKQQTSGLSQSNDYYERVVISVCPSLPNRSNYLINNELI